MLRWLLRQLNVWQRLNTKYVEYRCKDCDIYVTIELTLDEWRDIYFGIPFNIVFRDARKQELIHFKYAKCKDCLLLQQQKERFENE